MKALVYHGNKDLRVEDVPEPSPAPGWVKLRVDYCGICATDVEEYLYGPKFIFGDTPNPITGVKMPLITGHEVTGTVVELGRGVSSLRVGQRAVLYGVLTCGACWWCTHGQAHQCPSMAAVGFGINGGLAEYIVWPASQVIPLPANMTSEQAGLVEPGSVALHAVHRGRIQRGDNVAVLGVGTVGILAMQLARAMGARIFAIDRRQMALDLAKGLGADATINAESTDVTRALLGLTNGVGPDVVIDAAGGKETPWLAIQWARRGGRAVLVAIYTARTEVDFTAVVGAETEIVGSIAYQQAEVEEVVRLIALGAVKATPLISDTIPLEDVVSRGFARMMAPAKDVFRILVAPSMSRR